MPVYKYTVTCTCDEPCDDPCPAHGRENYLQDRVLGLLNEIENWKDASGLSDSRGDPDGVTPDDLRKEITRLRQIEESIPINKMESCR